MEERLIITAALTGSRPTKEMNPAVPYSPQEIAAAAVDAWRAGASVVHIHVRDPDSGEPLQELDLFRETVERIRGQCDVLINLTTSGLFLPDQEDFETRLVPLQLQPDLCSLDVGSMNFQDRVFYNPPAWASFAARRMRTVGVKPEVEVFELGHIHQARELIEHGDLEAPVFFQLCMGVRWGVPATEENLIFMKESLPNDSIWSALGVGRMQQEIVSLSISLGGHARVGLEDNLYIRKGVLAKSSAEQVEWVVKEARQAGRAIASAIEARQILKLEDLARHP